MINKPQVGSAHDGVVVTMLDSYLRDQYVQDLVFTL